jgi:uncharacterized membrane protein YdfJ with MMPL/SSD domain
MKESPAGRLGDWSVRHRRTAVIGWLLFVVLAAVAGGAAGGVEATGAEMGAGDSRRADRILEDAGIEEPAGEAVMLTSRARDGWREAARDLTRALEAGGRTGTPQEPVASRDGRSGLLRFTLKGPADTAGERVQPVLDTVGEVRRAHPDVTVHQYGRASADQWLGDMLGDDFARAELTAVPLALGILLVVFGAVVAALLPVALALTAFVAANGVLMLLSHLMPLDPTTTSVMLLIGLAVGVDYCLFYLRRERDERAAGADAATALRVAAATSGRAVLVSGLTVMVAMAGMFLSGLLLFEGFALATILVVLVAMLGSVTVLPALLSWLGDRVEKGRLPLLARRARRGGRGRVSAAVLRPVLARPGVCAALAGAAVLLLAAPAAGMRTEQLGLDKQMPAGAPLRVAHERITATFPGGPAPARVVVAADDVTAPRVTAAVADFRAAVAGNRAFGDGVTVGTHRAAGVVVIDVPLAGDGTGPRSRAALETLRGTLVPGLLEPVATGGRAYVTGELAGSVDFTDQLKKGIVPVLVFITAVTFLIMLVCFRSLPVAALSVALNLLSVAAAYGVMTAVFQHGWGAGALGTESVGAVEAWMPLFVLVVLFGLSMDYHVFVVSRIREAHDRGLPAKEAVREGVQATAGSVTGAAAIMVAVFSVFATLSMQDMQQMGVGLASAVLLDATLVRMVLLPAGTALLGERAWYLPRFLRARPRAGHGGGAGRPGPKVPDSGDTSIIPHETTGEVTARAE